MLASHIAHETSERKRLAIQGGQRSQAERFTIGQVRRCHSGQRFNQAMHLLPHRYARELRVTE